MAALSSDQLYFTFAVTLFLTQEIYITPAIR
jgi:hypothetical protein